MVQQYQYVGYVITFQHSLDICKHLSALPSDRHMHHTATSSQDSREKEREKFDIQATCLPLLQLHRSSLLTNNSRGNCCVTLFDEITIQPIAVVHHAGNIARVCGDAIGRYLVHRAGQGMCVNVHGVYVLDCSLLRGYYFS